MSWRNPFGAQLQRIEETVNAILAAITKEIKMTQAEFDQLSTSVAAENTVEQSAITLLNGLTAIIKANANDPTLAAKLQASIDANKATLAAAVAANTPAAPPAA